MKKIYLEVKRIKKGNTKTYGEIAKKVGASARVVGVALHKNPDPKNIPCHRVVFKDGSLSNSCVFGGIKAQEKKLKQKKTLK
ncbi:MAG: Methylated-DNA--protein-cysteine methyltransferase [Candidatus Anoxychlamydiales bacterium]|nr:Methylated-DNA--protein-cysteine methyltransferase [Candidatus Anoxychlamydiales bacterium]